MAKENKATAVNQEKQADHVVTEETLALNPDLKDQGVEIGETVQYAETAEQEEIYLQKIAVLETENESLKTELAEAQEIAAEALKGYNFAVEKAPDAFEIEVESGRAKINFGVNLNGKYYTAADLTENAEVVEELLAMGSGAITLLED